MNVVRRLSSSAGAASCTRSVPPEACGSSCSATELIANTAGSVVRTVACSWPPKIALVDSASPPASDRARQ